MRLFDTFFLKLNCCSKNNLALLNAVPCHPVFKDYAASAFSYVFYAQFFPSFSFEYVYFAVYFKSAAAYITLFVEIF